jgi:multicomponent Na+:H+ antiporter subunit F
VTLMIDIFYCSACIITALILPALYRAAKGPTAFDRLVAANVIGTKATVLLVIIGLVFDSPDMFVDLALVYAILNFIGSLAAASLLKPDEDLNIDGVDFDSYYNR